MKTRIIKNRKTTLLGIFLLALSTTLLCMKVISLTEYAAFFPTILGLLYVRDSIFKINPNS